MASSKLSLDTGISAHWATSGDGCKHSGFLSSYVEKQRLFGLIGGKKELVSRLYVIMFHSKGVYRFCCFVDMDSSKAEYVYDMKSFESAVEQEPMGSKKFVFQIRFTDDGREPLMFVCTSDDEKQRWVCAVNDVMQELHNFSRDSGFDSGGSLSEEMRRNRPYMGGPHYDTISDEDVIPGVFEDKTKYKKEQVTYATPEKQIGHKGQQRVSSACGTAQPDVQTSSKSRQKDQISLPMADDKKKKSRHKKVATDKCDDMKSIKDTSNTILKARVSGKDANTTLWQPERDPNTASRLDPHCDKGDKSDYKPTSTSTRPDPDVTFEKEPYYEIPASNASRQDGREVRAAELVSEPGGCYENVCFHTDGQGKQTNNMLKIAQEASLKRSALKKTGLHAQNPQAKPAASNLGTATSSVKKSVKVGPPVRTKSSEESFLSVCSVESSAFTGNRTNDEFSVYMNDKGTSVTSVSSSGSSSPEMRHTMGTFGEDEAYYVNTEDKFTETK